MQVDIDFWKTFQVEIIKLLYIKILNELYIKILNELYIEILNKLYIKIMNELYITILNELYITILKFWCIQEWKVKNVPLDPTKLDHYIESNCDSRLLENEPLSNNVFILMEGYGDLDWYPSYIVKTGRWIEDDLSYSFGQLRF